MNDLALSEEDNGQSCSIPLGARIVVRLAENPTTGYCWDLRSVVTPVLEFEHDDYTSTSANGVGGGGTRIFQFVAVTAGTQTILLKLMRRWEDETKAISVFSAIVIVTA
ncbi:MAG: protease inhibitor I42 family protein [Thermoguttaceae bacterium]